MADSIPCPFGANTEIRINKVKVESEEGNSQANSNDAKGELRHTVEEYYVGRCVLASSLPAFSISGGAGAITSKANAQQAAQERENGLRQYGCPKCRIQVWGALFVFRLIGAECKYADGSGHRTS